VTGPIPDKVTMINWTGQFTTEEGTITSVPEYDSVSENSLLGVQK